MRNRTAPHPDRFARSEQFEVFTRPQRSRPARLLGLAIRLRAEISAAVVLLLVWRWLTELMPAWAAGLVLAGLAGTVAAIPHSRGYVYRRALAVLTRHRLRAVFVERRVMNWSGNLPVLLWSPRPQSGNACGCCCAPGSTAATSNATSITSPRAASPVTPGSRSPGR